MRCVSVSVPSAGDGLVDVVCPTVAMTHTWIGDLTIKLISPANTVVTLMSLPGTAEAADNGASVPGDSSNLLATFPISFQTRLGRRRGRPSCRDLRPREHSSHAARRRVSCRRLAKPTTKRPCPEEVSSPSATSASIGWANAGTADSLAADSKRKNAKEVVKLSGTIAGACDARGATGAALAGGRCSSLTGPALATCIDQRVACRVCQTINDGDVLLGDGGPRTAMSSTTGRPTAAAPRPRLSRPGTDQGCDHPGNPFHRCARPSPPAAPDRHPYRQSLRAQCHLTGPPGRMGARIAGHESVCA